MPGRCADDALRGQHLGMRQAAGDVGLPQALVEKHAGGVALDQVAHRLGEQGRPGLGFLVELVLLEDLSELFRSALANPLQDVTLAQEVHLAERYLAIEQVRFGDRLRLTWTLDAAASAARLPPLILQPLVENAVRHGVEPSPSGADVHISTQRRGDRVVIKVSNSMPGGAGPAGTGLALANVGERLALLHDLNASLRHGVVGGVFQVRMEVPA
jgi:two-component system sensor histidine kinase AlgZ